jgi:hypothetical protein
MKSPASTRPTRVSDLLVSERRFVVALDQLGFGRLEAVRIWRGELVLDPSPAMVQVLKFGTESAAPSQSGEFELKGSLLQFFDYVRGVDDGEIRRIEVRHGLPFSVEIERRISRGVPDVKGEHVEAV